MLKSEEIFLKGKKYISSKKASESTGYTNDYIGQLCRGNKVKSEMVGRTRFVEENSLLNYVNTPKGNEKTFSSTLVEEKKDEFKTDKNFSQKNKISTFNFLTLCKQKIPAIVVALFIIIVVGYKFDKIPFAQAGFQRIFSPVSSVNETLAGFVEESFFAVSEVKDKVTLGVWDISKKIIPSADTFTSVKENTLDIPKNISTGFFAFSENITDIKSSTKDKTENTFNNVKKEVVGNLETAAIVYSRGVDSFGEKAISSKSKAVTGGSQKIKNIENSFNQSLNSLSDNYHNGKSKLTQNIRVGANSSNELAQGFVKNIYLTYKNYSDFVTDSSVAFAKSEINYLSDVSSSGKKITESVRVVGGILVESPKLAVNSFEKISSIYRNGLNNVVALNQNLDKQLTANSLQLTAKDESSQREAEGDGTSSLSHNDNNEAFQNQNNNKTQKVTKTNFAITFLNNSTTLIKNKLSGLFNSTKLKTNNITHNLALAVNELENISTNKAEQFALNFYKTVSSLFEKDKKETILVQQTKDVVEETQPSSLRALDRSGEASQSSVVQNIINQPIQERVIETIVERVVSGVTLADLQTLNNELKTEIYRVANDSATQTSSNYQAIALTNKIDNLSSVTINNSTITGGTITGATFGGSTLSLTGTVTAGSGTFSGGVSGTTGSFSSDLSTAGQLTVSGTATSTMAGDFAFDTNTLYIDSVNNRVGVGTTSPSDTLAVNGAAYFASISAPSNTADRLYNISNDLYWNGSLLGGGSVGSWTASGSDVYRATGNVGIGTTSPFYKLSVEGNSSLGNQARAGYFTATSTTATSTFPYLATTQSNVGTVVGGIWNGSSIGDIYIDDTITASNYLALTNWFATTTHALISSLPSLSITESQVSDLSHYTDNDWDIRMTSTTTLPKLTTLLGLTNASSTQLTTTGNTWLATTGGNVGIGTTSPFAKLSVTNTTASTIAQIIKGASSQSANLTEWQDNTGAVTLAVQANGDLFTDRWLGQDTNTFVGVGVVGAGNLTHTTGSEGYYNTAQGYQALYTNTTGSNNSAQGMQALFSNTTGIQNSAQGMQALFSNTTGNYNSAQGMNALRFNTTGYQNTAQGVSALYNNTTGYYNSAQGMNALYANTTGYRNSAQGMDTLRSNTTGIQNSAQGAYALYSNTTGNYNSAQGYAALYDLGSAQTAGAFNIGTSYTIATVGTTDFTLIGSADNNVGTVFTATGAGSGTGTATPNNTSNNTALGYNTGRGIIYGTGNTILGANITGLSAGLTNNIILADGDGNQRINVDGSGNVGVGNSSPSYKLDVTGFINSDGTVGGYKIDGNTVLQASSTNYSTLVGRDAGKDLLSDGFYNTALGYMSLYTSTSSDYNTAVGYKALYTNTTGVYNSAQGVTALYSNTTGYSNSAQGYQALYSNTTGIQNSAQGMNALYTNTTGNYNSAQGVSALYNNTTGYYNSAQGYAALYSNTTGNQNTAQGVSALRFNTTGNNNSAQGMNALRSNTTGIQNSAQGTNALYDLGSAQTAGAFNIGTSYTIATVGTTDFTLIGSADNVVGTVFTATGAGSGTGTATPNGTNSNTAIGYNTGRGIIYGTGNTILGANITGLSAGLTNNIILADGLGNQRINVDSSGNVGIGTTSPTHLLTVGTSAGGSVCIDNGAGGCNGAGTTAGDIYYNAAHASYADIAEKYPTEDETLEAGEIVSLDSNNKINIKRAEKGEETLGIISTNPGLILGDNYSRAEGQPVALSGRVPVKVNLEGGEINIGDRIILSSTAGVGMKASTTGRTVGVALEELTAESLQQTATSTSSTGLIMVFVENELTITTNIEALANKVDELEMRIADLEQLTTNNLQQVVGSVSIDSVLAYFESLGVKMMANVVEFKNIVVEKITADKVVTNGIEMMDEVTGEVYCVKIQNGIMANIPGECSSLPASMNDSEVTQENPTITIQGNNPAQIEIGATYVDMGVIAKDSNGNDLSVRASVFASDREAIQEGVSVSQISLDTSTSTTYTITYTTTDNNGTTVSVEREVVVGEVGSSQPTANSDDTNDEFVTDTEGLQLEETSSTTPEIAEEELDTIPPTISLVGSDILTIEINQTYTDEGATATDEIDGDITNDIITNNSVDTTTAGTYTITYNVTDTAGNEAVEVVRTVTVIEPVVILEETDTASSTPEVVI